MNINLYEYCDKSEYRKFLSAPITNNEFTVATDGTVFVEIPADGRYTHEDNESYLKVQAMFKNHAILCGGDGLCIPEFKCVDADCPHCIGTGIEPECPSCEGHGTIELNHDWVDKENKWHHNEYEVDCVVCEEHPTGTTCHKCEGAKTIKSFEPEQIEIGSQLFMAKNLERIKFLPNIRIFNSSELLGGARFSFDGGKGLIIPYRRAEDCE